MIQPARTRVVAQLSNEEPDPNLLQDLIDLGGSPGWKYLISLWTKRRAALVAALLATNVLDDTARAHELQVQIRTITDMMEEPTRLRGR